MLFVKTLKKMKKHAIVIQYPDRKIFIELENNEKILEDINEIDGTRVVTLNLIEYKESTIMFTEKALPI